MTSQGTDSTPTQQTMLSLLTPKRPTAPPQRPNYGVYLVTDSTPAILGSKDLAVVVEDALKGGVTCVQYRDKNGDKAAVVEMARRLHAITKRYGVPFLINDRVDVAVEIGCEGIHIGQDDMSEFDYERMNRAALHVSKAN